MWLYCHVTTLSCGYTVMWQHCNVTIMSRHYTAIWLYCHVTTLSCDAPPDIKLIRLSSLSIISILLWTFSLNENLLPDMGELSLILGRCVLRMWFFTSSRSTCDVSRTCRWQFAKLNISIIYILGNPWHALQPLANVVIFYQL